MMTLSRELAVFIAPFINSYKRYASLSWAPVNVVWGRDNRTTGFRLVGRGPALHVENRFPGGDMNAYLTYAAMIGAGLYGIEHEPQARARVQGQRLHRDRPSAHAARAVRGDPASWSAPRRRVEIFGEDVVDHYLNAARVEQETYDSVVHRGTASATSSAADRHATVTRRLRMPTTADRLAHAADGSSRERDTRSRTRSTGSPKPPARAPDMHASTRTIHEIVGGADGRPELLHRPLRRRAGAINFPYYVDAVDEDLPDPRCLGAVRHRQRRRADRRTSCGPASPSSFTRERLGALVAAARSRPSAMTGEDWLGVPLPGGRPVIGIVVVQTYDADEHLQRRRTSTLLTFVGQHIASALTRARAIEETRAAQRRAGPGQRDRAGARAAARVRGDHRARRRADPRASSRRARCSSPCTTRTSQIADLPVRPRRG